MLLKSLSVVATSLYLEMTRSPVPGDDFGREALTTVSKPQLSPSASQGRILSPWELEFAVPALSSVVLISQMSQIGEPKAS